MAAPAAKRQHDAHHAPAKRAKAADDASGALHLPNEVVSPPHIEATTKEWLQKLWKKIDSRNKEKWNEVAWMGRPLTYDEVLERIGEEKAKKLDWVGLWSAEAVGVFNKKQKPVRDENGQPKAGPAAFFFSTARLVDDAEDANGNNEIVTEVTLGESVELNTNPVYHLRIEMFIADIHGEMFLLGRWFYKPLETFIAVKQPKEDTKETEGEVENGEPGIKKPAAKSKTKKKEFEKLLPVEPEYLDDRRVWICSDRDDIEWNNIHLVNSINKKVVVKHVHPGHLPPPKGLSPDNKNYCDFWFDQSHDRMFCTFEDYYPEGTKEHAMKKQLEVAQQQEKQVLNVLELFAGAGGLSFLAQSNSGVDIRGRWAVDFWDDACLTYKANNPETHVFNIGIDEFLWFCKKFKKLSDKYPRGWKGKNSTTKKKHQIKRIDEMAFKDDAPREQKNSSSKGQLLGPILDHQCWLVFHVTLAGDSENLKATLKEQDFEGNEVMLAAFVEQIRQKKGIPQPGDVHLVAGGPPCQNISGLNRHAKRSDVLNDPKNRLVQTYYEVINFFKPKFTLMEQVQGIILKEGGRYLKFAVAMMLHDRYQVRIGLMAAGDFGCAQGRFRVFTWGALSGEAQLPPFPEPSHRCQHFNTPVGSEGQECRVCFLSEESKAAAHHMVLLGDVLSDLPEIDTYCFADHAQYKCDPHHPFQVYIRRTPKPGEADLLTRFFVAEGGKKVQIGEGRKAMLKTILDTYKNEGAAGLGFKYLCREAQSPTSYYGQIWIAELAAETDEKLRIAKMQQRDANRKGYCITLGKQIYEAASRAFEVEKQVEAMRTAMSKNQKRGEKAQDLEDVKLALVLRDHRPLMTNSDDYLRMVHVPIKEQASFLDWPGVYANADGTCCGGHYHAPRRATSNKKGISGCLGGGVKDEIKRSIHKSTRVDHHDKDGWRGTSLQGCPSYTVWMPTGSTLCPRWCLTYKDGRQSDSSRHICYGRLNPKEFPPTVVGRAEPHNMRILHPTQNRVMTVRENARCQGFPDYYVFVAKYREKDFRAGSSMKSRYVQIGNAVAPPVASALGRCLLMAAAWKVPYAQPIVAVPDPELQKAMDDAQRLGLQPFYSTLTTVPRLKCSILSENKPKAWGEEVVMPADDNIEDYNEQDEEDNFDLNTEDE